MSSDDKLTAKQQKAQRRAAAVAAKTANQPTKPSTQTKETIPPKKVQPKQDKVKDSKNEAKTTEVKVNAIPLFSHLDQRRPITSEDVPRDVHPAILALAMRYSSGVTIGSNARCKDMLRTFKKVISDYAVPSHLQTSLQRHLPTYLSTQITFLVTARPLSVGMGTAIRLLKQEISALDIAASDETSKEKLLDFIDTFVRERIEMAGQVITASSQRRIKDGDEVLIFGHSSTVINILLTAHKTKRFNVTIIDSQPTQEGRKSLSILSTAGLNVTYASITALSYLMPKCTTVFLGAHAVLANGSIYARCGTSMVAMSAHLSRVPVIVACETYKFSERVQLDAVTGNELGRTEEKKDGITRLNLMYDVTPAKFITMCVSELGSLPTTAIPFAALSEQTS